MLSWRAGRGTLRLHAAQHMGTLELWVSAGERREMRRGEKYSHQESRSRNTTRVQTLWKGQGLETLPFHKTARTGSDSWLQLLGKQGNRRNHCLCVQVQDKWFPGTFHAWECSFLLALSHSHLSSLQPKSRPQLILIIFYIFFYFFIHADVSDTILETNCQLPNNQVLHLFVRLALK